MNTTACAHSVFASGCWSRPGASFRCRLPAARGQARSEKTRSKTRRRRARRWPRRPASPWRRLRVAQHDGRLYLDIGDADWHAIEIGPAAGTSSTPRRCRCCGRAAPDRCRYRSRAARLDPLYDLLPIEGEDERRLVVLWLLAAMRPIGPYPILALSGEQGTGKSFVARALRRLVDPCGDDIMAPPRETRDLIAAARSNHVLALDNLSSISGELADSLCRLATGGDLGGRKLYSDDDSAAFAARRPICLNGIPDLATRGDLVSRSVLVRLAPMPRRRAEAELWATFDAAAPAILGALLDRPVGGTRPAADAAAAGRGGIVAHGRFRAVGDSRRAGVGLACRLHARSAAPQRP